MSIKELLLRELLQLSKSLGEDMTTERQLELWVEGQNIHNSKTDDCCPDFSCCQPDMEWEVENKILFAEAYVNQDLELVKKLMVKSIEALARAEYPDMEIDVVAGGLYD